MLLLSCQAYGRQSEHLFLERDGVLFSQLTRVRALIRERRLPADERRAAQADRRAEEQMRRERDHEDERARQLAAADAERHRYSGPGRFR